jgi:protein-arginine kinase activator protein McsA
MSLGKCDHCNETATVLVTEIKGGERFTKRLCDQCAAAEGLAARPEQQIAELLAAFRRNAGETP